MKNALITFKTKPQTKKQAQKVADELGFGLSALLNGFLNHLIKTKTIEFSAYPKEEPSEYLIKSLEEAEKEFQSGQATIFKNPQEALDYLDRLIEKQ